MEARQLLLRCFVFVSLVASPLAHGLVVEAKGSVAVISGDIDFPDLERVEAAYEAGARVIVIRGLSEGTLNAIEGLRRTVEKLGVDTVIDGPCGGACVIVFMAGKNRYFGKSTIPGRGSMAFVGGVVERGTNTPISDTTMYAVLSEGLNENMPKQLLNKYTSWWDGKSVLGISTPSATRPEGKLWDCPRGGSCTAIDDAPSPLKVGFITSSRVFDIDRQTLVSTGAPAPVPAVKPSASQSAPVPAQRQPGRISASFDEVELGKRISSKSGQEAFRDKYVSKTMHKAFAVSEDGPWSYVSNKSSAEIARAEVLSSCEAARAKRANSSKQCVIINIDGAWQ